MPLPAWGPGSDRLSLSAADSDRNDLFDNPVEKSDLVHKLMDKVHEAVEVHASVVPTMISAGQSCGYCRIQSGAGGVIGR